jgi:hypothetical protein
MDFIVFSGLIGTILQSIVFSYDIACQWSRNLPRRLQQLPESMHLTANQLASAQFVIPKFHIYAHGLSCQTSFSLNFLPFMARTDGEEPERWWAHINPVSMSTKEMGPGARLDTLDDHAAAWNWRKIVGMGEATDSITRLLFIVLPRFSSSHTTCCSRSNGPGTTRSPYGVHRHILC